MPLPLVSGKIVKSRSMVVEEVVCCRIATPCVKLFLLWKAGRGVANTETVLFQALLSWPSPNWRLSSVANHHLGFT